MTGAVEAEAHGGSNSRAERPGSLQEGPSTSAAPRSGAAGALGFVMVSLVALAVVPVLLGRRAAGVERQIIEVLEPAQALEGRLALIHARQMLHFQAYLLTGDRAFRDRYMRALREEQRAFEALMGTVATMDLSVREDVARLSTLAQRWHLGHQLVFDSEESRETLVDQLPEEQARYDEIQRASVELQGAIRGEVRQGRQAMTDARRLQSWITFGLVALALGATLVVGFVGRHVRVLSAESELRRRDAVRARRDIDALLEATGDGVLGIDLQGRCLSLNRAGSELLGFPEHEIVGRDVHETIHHARADGSPRPRDASPILRALARGERARAMEDVLWRRNGTPFPAQWFLRPLIDGTEVRGAVLTFTDVTEIREKEQALRRAVHARDEMVSIVSHDLRNPLGVVRAAAELILDLPLKEEERRTQAEIIRRSADRMGRLIEDLLDVARIEAGAFQVRTDTHDARDIIRDVEEDLSGMAARQGVSLSTEVPDDPTPLRADRDRVVQALGNLVGNALKFTPRGGDVSVGMELRADGGVAFTVRDSGPGIDPELRDHLFDRFWQAQRADRSGAGLGLAIVKAIAEAHGGVVEVDSRPGEGATFRLVLPGGGRGSAGGSVS